MGMNRRKKIGSLRIRGKEGDAEAHQDEVLIEDDVRFPGIYITSLSPSLMGEE